MGQEHHGHDHHGRGLAPSAEGRIGVAFVLNLAFTLIEIVGGLWTNSMAVLSDALHDLGDSIALGLSWHFARISKRKGDETFTFGYRRFSLLGALVMSIVLFAGGLVVLFEAIPRILHPEATNVQGMLRSADSRSDPVDRHHALRSLERRQALPEHVHGPPPGGSGERRSGAGRGCDSGDAGCV